MYIHCLSRRLYRILFTAIVIRLLYKNSYKYRLYLAWVVFGAIAQSNPSPLVSLTATSDPSIISELLYTFWTVEEPKNSPPFTTGDQLFEELFTSTIQRLSLERFCVALTFRNQFLTINQQLTWLHVQNSRQLTFHH